MTYKQRKRRDLLWFLLKPALLLVVIVAALAVAFTYNSILEQKAKDNAQEYAANVPGASGAVHCNRFDTDQDGYISCTVFLHTGNPLQIECGFSGCRAPKPNMKVVAR